MSPSLDFRALLMIVPEGVSVRTAKYGTIVYSEPHHFEVGYPAGDDDRALFSYEAREMLIEAVASRALKKEGK